MINLFLFIISIFVFIVIIIWIKNFFQIAKIVKNVDKEIRRLQVLSSVFADTSNKDKYD
jgi:uncharacterized membrane protein